MLVGLTSQANLALQLLENCAPPPRTKVMGEGGRPGIDLVQSYGT